MAYMVDRDAPYSGLASIMAMNGRYGDTELVHMSKPEIRGLASLGELTINPETGLPEAFSLKSALPMIGGLAASFLLPGLAPTIFSGTMGGMFASGIGTFAGGLLAGKGLGEAALGGIMGGVASGAMSGLSGLLGGAESVGADAVANAATSTVADTAVSNAALESSKMAGLEIGANAPDLISSVSDGVSAAYPAPTVPSSGIMDWISNNPGKTAVGGLGLAGLLAAGEDEEYPEEQPIEIDPLPQFNFVGHDIRKEDKNLSEEEVVRRATEGYRDTADAQYFTRSRFVELDTGGLVGLNSNQGASQSSQINNFLQSESGNNEQNVFDSMFNVGAAAAGKAGEKEQSKLITPVDVTSPVENTGRLRLELLGGGKHRYVRDEMPTVQELVEVNPVPDTIEELSDNAEDQAEGFSGQDQDPGGMTPRGLSIFSNQNPKTSLTITGFKEASPARSTVTKNDIAAYNAAKADMAFSNPQTQATMDVGYDATMDSTAGSTSTNGTGTSTGSDQGFGFDAETGEDGAGAGAGTGSDSGDGTEDEGAAAATGGLISMLKKANGGLLREAYPAASSIIKKWESVRQSGKPHLTAYQDDANNWTIGFGKNLGKKKPLDKQGNLLTWTSEQAEADHEDQLKGVLKDIKSLEKKSGYTFNSKQINGLIPLIQNIGLNQLIKSKAGKKTKALKALEKGNIETFFDETYGDKGFINVNGKKAIGLVNRRAEEGSLFNNPLPRPKIKPELPKQQVVAEDFVSRSGVMKYPRTAKDTSYKGGIEGLEGGKLLEKIREYIPFSEGGTLEQYYQGQVIGKGDGMSDEILFDVEGRNPDMALLSRDEYVIPADVVSMIGNGSSNAGAEELDGFLKNVRHQSFGTRKQQREMTNPQKGLSALV